MEFRRIINEVSLTRFVKEIMAVMRKHPDAELECGVEAGDDPRAENAFMFGCVLNYTKQGD